MRRMIVPVAMVAALLGACGGSSAAPHAKPSPEASATGAAIPTMSMLDQLGRVAAAETAEASKPRFQGELLGIAIAPTFEELPPDVQQEHERLVSSGACTVIAVEQAAPLALPRPLVLPEGYAAREGFPQATACGGQPSGLEWDFSADGGASVSVARSIGRYDVQDVAASRVSIRDINGRNAVVLSPITPDGVAQRSAVYFPEPFGMTIIYAFNMPVDDLLAVAADVAEATR